MTAACRYAYGFNHIILHDTHQWLVLTCGMTSRALQCISKRLKATTSIVRCYTCIHMHTHAYICVAAVQKLLMLSERRPQTNSQHMHVSITKTVNRITKTVNRPRSQTNCIAAQPRDASILGCLTTQLIATHVRFNRSEVIDQRPSASQTACYCPDGLFITT